jgi:ribosomal protein L34
MRQNWESRCRLTAASLTGWGRFRDKRLSGFVVCTLQRSFPHARMRPERKMRFCQNGGFSDPKAFPITPLTAEERGAKRRRVQQQTTETKKKFRVSGFEFRIKTKNEIRVLTDRNVSTTTRNVDDAER